MRIAPNGSLFMFNRTPQPLLQSRRLEELPLTNQIVMASLTRGLHGASFQPSRLGWLVSWALKAYD
jgi:hypothetical protein